MLEGISLEKQAQAHKMPRVVVVGIGGGGSNAVKNMIEQHLEGCEFCVCNTDSQALHLSPCDNKFLLGKQLTAGLGAGGNPEVGRKAAEEDIKDIEDFIDGADMVFLSVGMGGGTGTGAAPVIAEMIKNKHIVCVGVVSKPFSFENTHRMKVAEAGIEDLQQHVDTLIVIPNENLINLVAEDATFTEALKTVDDVLLMGVRAVADLMLKPGQINLDFNDIRAVVKESGKAIIGIGEVKKSEYQEETAEVAAQLAISNSLLEYNNIGEARAVLVNVTASENLSFIDMTTACNTVRKSVHPDANVIFGMSLNTNPEFEDIIRLSVLATGISNQAKATATTQIGSKVMPAHTAAPETEHVDTDADTHINTDTPTQTDEDLDYLNDLQSIEDTNADMDPPADVYPPSDSPPIEDTAAVDSPAADSSMDPTVQAQHAPQTSDTQPQHPFTLSTPAYTAPPAAENPPAIPDKKTIYDTVDKNIDTLKSDGFDFDQDTVFTQQKKQQSGGLLGKWFNRNKSPQTPPAESTPPKQQRAPHHTSDSTVATTEIPEFLKNQRD